MKTFSKILEYHFLIESPKNENATFPDKTALSEARIELGVQNGPITESGVLPVTT